MKAEHAAQAVEHATAATEHAAEVASHAGGFLSLSDPYTWVLCSALIFVGIAIKAGKKPILGFLDGRRESIKTELEEAKALRAEAAELLKEYEAKHKTAMSEAEDIIADAKSYAEKLRAEAEKELKEKAKRQEEILLNRIAAAEKEALNDIRNQALEVATKAAQKMIADNIKKHDARLVNETITEIKKAV